jgi:hypothetical protein
MDTLVAIYFLAAPPIAAVPAFVARRRGQPRRVLVVVIALSALGLLALGFAGLAQLYDGYVEDAGSKPAETTGKAIAGLVTGAVCVAAAWFAALRRPKEA